MSSKFSAQLLFSAFAALIALTLHAGGAEAQPPGTNESPSAVFVLSTTCPASFERNNNGGCVLRNRYRDYASLRDAGVGGLKSGLPRLREGFTPEQIDLGRYLFFDPILSTDGTVSCASCHDPSATFGHTQGQQHLPPAV
jgi:cytochrome c peroxidase